MYYRRNYGGVLQCYALQQTLKCMGHDVEVINFKYDSVSNQHVFSKVESLLKKIKTLSFGSKTKRSHIAVRPLPKAHIQAFEDFKKNYMLYSREVGNDTLSTLANQYDAVVVGSDQVWNDVSGKRLFYFFDWNPSYEGIRVAYAPCSVTEDIPFYNKKKLHDLLMDMDSISVRDKSTARLVEKAVRVEPSIVLDPTGLYDFNEFINNPIVEGDYIFAYILGSEIHCGHTKVISKIKERYGEMKTVAAIIPNVSLEVEKFADDVRYNATPVEWVNLIANAKFVYTDSFHGCMFSIKYHKPFFAYYKDKRRSSRLHDLMEMYSFKNIMPSGVDPELSDVDYQSVDRILEEQKKSSLAFLEKALPLNK